MNFISEINCDKAESAYLPASSEKAEIIHGNIDNSAKFISTFIAVVLE